MLFYSVIKRPMLIKSQVTVEISSIQVFITSVSLQTIGVYDTDLS